MDNKDYLDFDETVAYLKTTSSTLYKWLQAGRIPGHKLGRQWRFLKEELDLFISGKSQTLNFQKEKMQLAQLLESRTKTKEGFMGVQVNQLAEKIIWDAFDHGSRLIHIYPAKGNYEISYRNKKGLDVLTTVQEEFFQELDKTLINESQPVGDSESRRMYFHRDDANKSEALQIRYQKLETVTGPRLTLSLWQPEKDVLPLEKIVSGDKTVLEKFKSWTEKPQGLILVTGASGSGKTTTIYSLLNEFKNTNRAIYTIEDKVQLIIEGIHQIELKSTNQKDFETIVEKVYSSDPDVICLGLTLPYGIEEKVFSAAYRAAATGHLVIVQMSEPTPKSAVEQFQKYCPYPIDHLLVGVSSQKLVSKNQKLTAEYDFL